MYVHVCIMLVSMLHCILHSLYDTQQVYNLLRNQGHNVVAVFTVPDDAQTGRADPLAEQAAKDGMPVLKYNRWRQKKAPIPEVSVPSPSLTVSLSHSLSLSVTQSFTDSPPLPSPLPPLTTGSGGVQVLQCRPERSPILHSVHSNGGHQSPEARLHHLPPLYTASTQRGLRH